MNDSKVVVPRMGFEPMNSYENGFLIRCRRLPIDLESVAFGQLGYLGTCLVLDMRSIFSHFRTETLHYSFGVSSKYGLIAS